MDFLEPYTVWLATVLEFQRHPGNKTLIAVISLETHKRPNKVGKEGGGAVMFSVIETSVVTKYCAQVHCHAETTNSGSTFIPDIFGGLAPLPINCLAWRNKFVINNALKAKETSQTLS
jgi:hypothetical protein